MPHTKKGIDPWGHVSVNVVIDGSQPETPVGLIETVQKAAIASGIPGKVAKKIEKFEIYLSFYPQLKKPLSEAFTPEELKAWIEGTSTGDPSTDKGKERSLYLFTQSYKAHNSNYKEDVDEYGSPDNMLTFSSGLDYHEIIRVC